MELDVSDEIKNTSATEPHIVLLGAGASRAAFPDGEASGRPLPLMEDFSQIVPIRPLLEKSGVEWRGRGFEDVYSSLAANPDQASTLAALEAGVYAYFDALALPTQATIYDALILSLRRKDVIATFNWDPFLIQALRRNCRLAASLPRLLFLHGNVLAGYCVEHQVAGVKGNRCSSCGSTFVPSQLLYPISRKNYQGSPLKAIWQELQGHLRGTLLVTIFGYSAPSTDVEALDLMSQAWGEWKSRQFEQIEFIDRKNESDLLQSWKAFVWLGHHDVRRLFRESWIAKHPRRTIEAFRAQNLDAAFIADNPLPDTTDLSALQTWFAPLIAAESGDAVTACSRRRRRGSTRAAADA